MRLSCFSIALLTVSAALAAPASADGWAAPVNASIGAGYSNMSPSGYVELGSMRASLQRAALALEEKRYTDAARILDDLVVKFESAGVYRLAAVAHAGSGNLPAAEANFVRALQLNPRDANAQAALGIVQLRQGKRVQAAETLRLIENRQKLCAHACERTDEIDRAVQVLSTALS